MAWPLTPFRAWWRQVITAARTGLKAASPSKVFTDLGQTIPQGLAAGIGQQAHLATNAVQSMVNGAIAAGGTSTPGAIGGITPLAGVGPGANSGGGSLTVNLNIDGTTFYQHTWPQLQTVLLQNKRAIVELGLS